MSNITNMFNSTQNNTIKVLCELYKLDMSDVCQRYTSYIKSYDNNRMEDKSFNEFIEKEFKKIEKMEKKNNANKKLAEKEAKAKAKAEAKALAKAEKEAKKLAEKEAKAKAKTEANADKKECNVDVLKKLGDELKKEYSIQQPEAKEEPVAKEEPIKKPVFYKPKVVLPYCGMINELSCQAVRKNGGLYSQCLNKPIKNCNLCMTCEKNRNKREDKKPEFGYINERGLKFNGITKKYSEILKKKKISKEIAIEEASKLGWVIPESEFEIVKRAAGRPKKVKQESEIKPKKKRGRPQKNKEIKIAKGDDDLEKLIDNLDNLKLNGEEDVEIHVEEEVEVNVEEEVEVIRFMFNDKEYYKDNDNTIYSFDTQEELGHYNKEQQLIEFY